MRRRTRFRAIALLAVVALSAVPAFAVGRRQAVRSPEARSVFASLWQALGEFFPVLKGRITIDPNGTPASTAPAEDPSDGRSTIDPNG